METLESRIQEYLDNPHLQPQGRVTVEMRDERGKLKFREQGKNFISKLWAISALSWQRTGWANYPLNATVDGLEVYPFGSAGWAPIQFPNTTIACWNDTSAESPTTETRVITDGQGIVAYASRQPSGALDGARGAVNIGASVWDYDSETMVYDWPTSAGNGTFQSVGYTSCLLGTSETRGMLLARPSVRARRYLKLPPPATIFGDSHYNMWGMSAKPDASGDLIIPVMSNTNTLANVFCILQIAASDWNAGFSPNLYGAAEKTPAYSVSTGLTVSGRNISYNQQMMFSGEQGGYWWFVSWASGAAILFRVNKSTKAIDRVASLPSTATPFGVVVGSDMFVAHQGNDPTIYRYDLTSNPPIQTATITPSYGKFSGTLRGMSTDGTDLLLHMGDSVGVIRMNTSGTILRHLGACAPYRVNELGTTPYAGQVSGAGLGHYEPLLSIYRPNNGTTGDNVWITNTSNALALPRWRTTSLTPWAGTGANQGMIWANGVLNFMNPQYTGVTSETGIPYAEFGDNLGSRVLLGSPATKSSSNTMKITYEIQMPGFIT